jgi:hypothetical protein
MGSFKIEGLFYVEDLRQRIRAEMEQISPDIIERSAQSLYTRVDELAGGNFNICVKFYCLFLFEVN